MKNFNDIELLSSYLDGQLNSADSVRLESRISSHPELASALNDLRVARGVLRKLPARKAPRNFTLTRKMVGQKPPLPRSYSIFQFATGFATLLLVFSFAINALSSARTFGAAAPAFGMGGGGGGPAATEAPVAESAPVEEPSLQFAAVPTQTASSPNADDARQLETATAEALMTKEAVAGSEPQDQSSVANDTVIPFSWQVILVIIILISVVAAIAINQNAKRKWQ